MPKSVVTGGAGFIGSNLVDLLVDEGHDVLVLDDLSSGSISNLKGARSRGNVTLHQIDITRYQRTGARDLVGDRGNFNFIGIGAFTPVVFVAHVQ